MTKSGIFLYRQNILNDLKQFFPAHPLRQADGSLFMKWTVADYAFIQCLSQPSKIRYARPAHTEDIFRIIRFHAYWIMDHEHAAQGSKPKLGGESWVVSKSWFVFNPKNLFLQLALLSSPSKTSLFLNLTAPLILPHFQFPSSYFYRVTNVQETVTFSPEYHDRVCGAPIHPAILTNSFTTATEVPNIVCWFCTVYKPSSVPTCTCPPLLSSIHTETEAANTDQGHQESITHFTQQQETREQHSRPQVSCRLSGRA